MILGKFKMHLFPLDGHPRFSYIGLCLLLLAVFSFKELHAASGTEGAAFLDIPVGAGPAAMGSAYAALAHDAYAPIYNPAGLGFVPGTQVAAQHLSYLDSLNDEFLSFVHPIGQGNALGISAQYLGTGSIDATGPNNGESLGSYSSHYAAYSLAFGQKVTDRLSLGLTGKWINAQLADVSANAYAADLGSYYKVSDRLNLALTAVNFGSHLKFIDQSDTLPEAVHLGAAYQPEKHWTFTGESVYSVAGSFAGRFGAAWNPLDMVQIRAGYKTDTLKELSVMAGLTVGMGLKIWGQEFAYAWLPYGDLGDTQYFSLLMKFGAKDEEGRNLIQSQAFKTQRTSGSLQSEDPETLQLTQLLEESEIREARR
jgi:hypothetical protein